MDIEVVIALGSNLGDRRRLLDKAVVRLRQEIGEVRAVSKFCETTSLLPEHVPFAPQPDYLNGAVRLTAHCLPHALLSHLLDIEQRLGRVRRERWGPRTVDLDFIAAGKLVICSATLALPHPEMHRRAFVLGPMLEVAPRWVHPLFQKTTEELYNEVLEQG